MQIALLIILFFAIGYYDARILNEADEDSYRESLWLPSWAWGVLLATPFLFLVTGLIYLILRRSYKKLRATKDLEGVEEESMSLFSDTLGALIAWVLGISYIALLIELLGKVFPDFDKGLGAMLLMAAFSLGLMVLLIYRVTHNKKGRGFRASIAWLTPQPTRTKAYAMAVFLGITFAIASATLLLTRDIQPSTPLSHALEANQSSAAMIFFVALAVLFAPLLEEVIFRGFLFGVIKNAFSQLRAITIITIIFGIMHVPQYWGDWMAIVMVGLLGWSLTMLRAWSHSCVPGVLTHYCYNGLLVLIPVVTLMVNNPAYMKYSMYIETLSDGEKIALLEESIVTSPKFVEAHNALAWQYAKQGENLDEALRLVEQAIYRYPQNGQFLDTKAEILFQLGRVNEAIEIEEDLVERYPTIHFYKKQLDRFNGFVENEEE